MAEKPGLGSDGGALLTEDPNVNYGTQSAVTEKYGLGSDGDGLLAAEDGAQQGQDEVIPSTLQQGEEGQGQIPPDNHAGLAWFSCLCCCWPIGLYAVITSHTVYGRWKGGDCEGANRASENAKNASIAAILIGTILCIVQLTTAVN
ncbi:conserved unknown protein [Ectocarpus siliculosus]|uniref:Uncharacterized protein n=1 Tax=Ectocarpus siliculosus TaxID=2880 RepID=D8LR93_ECTSI|nr:conserved unknown protein [Ectocarpus siliculosus]|eukprot:CBN74998.1 conserved unknown protein [Ectocarpus siliculosus]